MDTREGILRAALDTYAQYGFRGATTRRIADAAGVNEVTVFRHFGSKESLLFEALRLSAQDDPDVVLPERPAEPAGELGDWARYHYERLRHRRSMIRTCMGELEERPEFSDCATAGPRRLFVDLCRYLDALQEAGRIDPGADTRVAAAMLVSSMFSDAITRDMPTDIFPATPEDAPRRYVEMMLRALAFGTSGAVPDATGA